MSCNPSHAGAEQGLLGDLQRTNFVAPRSFANRRGHGISQDPPFWNSNFHVFIYCQFVETNGGNIQPKLIIWGRIECGPSVWVGVALSL